MLPNQFYIFISWFDVKFLLIFGINFQITPYFYYTIVKKLRLSHKLWFSNPYCFATQCVIFKAKYTVRSNNLSLKYQRFTPSGAKDKRIPLQSYQYFVINWDEKGYLLNELSSRHKLELFNHFIISNLVV